MAIAEWIVHETAKPADPPASRETALPGVDDGVVRLYYVNPNKSAAALTALVIAIRTKAGIQRIFPLTEPAAAVVLRGRADQMPMAESLVAEYAAAAQ